MRLMSRLRLRAVQIEAELLAALVPSNVVVGYLAVWSEYAPVERLLEA